MDRGVTQMAEWHCWCVCSLYVGGDHDPPAQTYTCSHTHTHTPIGVIHILCQTKVEAR